MLGVPATAHPPRMPLVLVTVVVVTTTTVTNTNGILGGWAVAGTPNIQRGITLGADWARVNAAGKIVPYTNYLAAPTGAANTWHSSAAIAANADKNLQFISPGAT